jgi:isoquinoline 1-oxidoreductase
LGQSVARPSLRDLVTGAHLFPSDYTRPGMLHGKVLRAPAYGAKLKSIDLGPVRALEGVVVVRDGDFIGVAAPSAFEAEQALEKLVQHAEWEPASHPSSKEVFDYLIEHAEEGVPENPFKRELENAHRKIRATYRVAYVQHAPMETRTALAEWDDGKLTVWTGTQNPFGYHGELARAFRLANDKVRVVVPDFGGGFGGKHTGEVAVEAARLAQGAGKPVLLRWTRAEEFAWAYFRPAGVIEAEATLDAGGQLTSWHFININSGGSAIETPYRAGNARSAYIRSQAPLRQGSYRALAATANTFARESLMDELASEARLDPFAFRMAHLENRRLRAVLESAAERFNWTRRIRAKEPGVGVGLACGTEKGSYVAACAEVSVDTNARRIAVRRVCQVFEAGAVMNPDNLKAQVAGCVLMGLGPALRESMEFEDGRMTNASFRRYLVPRFRDVPEVDVHLLDRRDLPSAGGSETPIIAIAPAIANAVFNATGKRIREMPIRLPAEAA